MFFRRPLGFGGLSLLCHGTQLVPKNALDKYPIKVVSRLVVLDRLRLLLEDLFIFLVFLAPPLLVVEEGASGS